MSEPVTHRPVRARRSVRGTIRYHSGPSAHVVVGFAHVGFGAWGVFSTLSQSVFAANGVARASFIASAVGGLASGMLALGGLWLADGRRRGAVLAVSMDGLRILALMFVGAIGSLSFVASLALGIAVVWVWPQLEPPSTVCGV